MLLLLQSIFQKLKMLNYSIISPFICSTFQNNSQFFFSLSKNLSIFICQCTLRTHQSKYLIKQWEVLFLFYHQKQMRWFSLFELLLKQIFDDVGHYTQICGSIVTL